MIKTQIKHIVENISLLSQFDFADLAFQKLPGLTNSNYLLETPESKYVLRIPQTSTNQFINREDESYNANIAEQLGIAPKCLWRGSGELTGVSLTEFIDETSKLNLQDPIDKIAKVIITLQKSKGIFKGTIDNKKIAEKIKQYFDLCTKHQQKSLQSKTRQAFLLLETSLSNRPNVPSHIDLTLGNILQKEDRIWVIDWEYSAMASPFWDISIFCESAGLDSNSSKSLLKQVLNSHLLTFQNEDLESFKNYQFITQVVSECWQSAFQIND